MKVLFDPQVFSFQEYGGISRYFYELINIFSRTEGISPELIIEYSNNKYLSNLNKCHVKKLFPLNRFKGRNEIIKLLNRKHFRREFLSRSKPNIFHPTYYHPYFLDLIGDVPFVLTIYDMSHELYLDSFSIFDFTSKNKRIAASKASRIIAISENTKKDIVRILQIPESKIDVIPLATTLSLNNSKKPEISLPARFLLYVGKRNTYKNFFFLLKAFSGLAKANSNYSLVCAGGGVFQKDEVKEIERLNLSSKVIQINVDDNELAYIYSKAAAFIYPSLYEGFGIPVLEAFACGCPAILSNRSSLPEVGGDAALYFDPENTDSLVAAFSEALDSSNTANQMKEKGFEKVKLFSWQNTAQRTLEIYKKLM